MFHINNKEIRNQENFYKFFIKLQKYILLLSLAIFFENYFRKFIEKFKNKLSNWTTLILITARNKFFLFYHKNKYTKVKIEKPILKALLRFFKSSKIIVIAVFG